MERRLAAILAADVFGYSRLMGEDEEATLRILSAYRKIIDSLLESHRGRFVNSAGDSVLAEFSSVLEAVNCAVEIQAGLKAENTALPPDRRMEFRIGVNLGDVMAEGEQIYGDGVNVAARLESLADPGGICLSGIVHDQVRDKLSLAFEDRGEQAVKNIARPVHVWRVLLNGAAQSRALPKPLPRKYWRGGVLSLGGLAIIIMTVVVVQHLSLKPQPTHASIPPAQSPALPLPDKPSIAVLPFINMSGDRDQEYFSDGITDDLITDLSSLPGLFVIARESAFTYKGKVAKLQEVGRELGVKYVLEGSVRKAGTQVRITVQLADATTGVELWAERYDRRLGDVFALQDELVRKIVTTLNLELALSLKGILIPRTTENLEAYDDLLRGMEYLASLTKDGNAKARPMFEKAIELDPKYAEAYARLGENYYVGWVLVLNSDPNGIKLALKMEQQAIAIDDSLSVAHFTMAGIDAAKNQYSEAETEARRAIALDPNAAWAYDALANVLNLKGMPAEALVAVDTAMRLDPRNLQNYKFEQGVAYTRLGRWAEAVSALKLYLASYPHNLWAHVWLADDYAGLDDDDAAQMEAAEVQQAIDLDPKSPLPYVGLAQVMNDTGRAARALAATKKAISLDPHNCVYLEQQGKAFTQLGQWREATTALKLFLVGYPANPWAHAWLAVDYTELGRNADARGEVAEVRRLDPEFSEIILLGKVPGIDRFRDDLRRAGLQ